jgi:hypothetical protein
MTTHAQSRSSVHSKAKIADLSPSQDNPGSELAAFIQPSLALMTLGEMRRAGLRYWLFWHTSAAHMLSRQLEMLTAGTADTLLAQPKQGSHGTTAA